MASDRVHLRLGDRNAYMYRTFRVRDAGRRWWCWGCCCRKEVAPAATGRTDSLIRDVPAHATPVFVNGPDVDDSWAVVLVESKLEQMEKADQTSIHVFSRHYNTPLFLARLDTKPKRGESITEWDVAEDAAVHNALRMCIASEQPANGVIRLVDDRRFLLRSVPIWDDRDVLVGALWSARPARVDDSTLTRLDRRRAAVYYDAETKLFVLNEAWLTHRNLIGDAIQAATDTDATVITFGTDGCITAVRNLDGDAHALVIDAAEVTDLRKLLRPAVAQQIVDGIAHLHNGGGGRWITGVSLDGLRYTVTTTKLVSGHDQQVQGYITIIAKTDGLGQLMRSLRPTTQAAATKD